MTNNPNHRAQGILLHITALPSEYGIGDLGASARAFIDYLAASGYQSWQILPLNFPGYGDSPYNPLSSFAGSPFLIDPDQLLTDGLVTTKELDKARLVNTGKVEFRKVYTKKLKLLRNAYIKFRSREKTSILTDFLEQERYWLKPFICFSYLKEVYKNQPWQKWKPRHLFYSDTLFQSLYNEVPDCLLFHVFLQYCFEHQLRQLKSYAESKNIRIIGDLPLYVALDSCDVWSHPELFELDDKGFPLRVAGVPPDAFSQTGQLWGNPLYNWDKMQQDGFDWWKRRLSKAFAFADVIRLDHFIGLVNYWAVPAGYPDAMQGEWLPGPQHLFFDSILRVFPPERFIAEDLGILTDEVNSLRDSYGFPGMIILQFCFQHEHNDVLSFPENKIIYTGTHDNQTCVGWYLSNRMAGKQDNQHLESYLHRIGFLADSEPLTEHNVAPLLTRLAQASPCRLCIIPIQDILALDDQARFNIPGTALGNWRWRLLSLPLSEF